MTKRVIDGFVLEQAAILCPDCKQPFSTEIMVETRKVSISDVIEADLHRVFTDAELRAALLSCCPACKYCNWTTAFKPHGLKPELLKKEPKLDPSKKYALAVKSARAKKVHSLDIAFIALNGLWCTREAGEPDSLWLELAIYEHERGVAASPQCPSDDGMTHLIMGELYRQHKDFDKALSEYELASQDKSISAEILSQLRMLAGRKVSGIIALPIRLAKLYFEFEESKEEKPELDFAPPEGKQPESVSNAATNEEPSENAPITAPLESNARASTSSTESSSTDTTTDSKPLLAAISSLFASPGKSAVLSQYDQYESEIQNVEALSPKAEKAAAEKAAAEKAAAEKAAAEKAAAEKAAAEKAAAEKAAAEKAAAEKAAAEKAAAEKAAAEKAAAEKAAAEKAAAEKAAAEKAAAEKAAAEKAAAKAAAAEKSKAERAIVEAAAAAKAAVAGLRNTGSYNKQEQDPVKSNAASEPAAQRVRNQHADEAMIPTLLVDSPHDQTAKAKQQNRIAAPQKAALTQTQQTESSSSAATKAQAGAAKAQDTAEAETEIKGRASVITAPPSSTVSLSVTVQAPQPQQPAAGQGAPTKNQADSDVRSQASHHDSSQQVPRRKSRRVKPAREDHYFERRPVTTNAAANSYGWINDYASEYMPIAAAASLREEKLEHNQHVSEQTISNPYADAYPPPDSPDEYAAPLPGLDIDDPVRGKDYSDAINRVENYLSFSRRVYSRNWMKL